MRRALVIGGVVALVVVAWLAFRPTDEQWVVAVYAENGLMYDEPCLPMDEVEESVATGGGEYNGLYKVRDEADGHVVARCYEEHGVEAEVRLMSEGDRQTWDELRG